VDDGGGSSRLVKIGPITMVVRIVELPDSKLTPNMVSWLGPAPFPVSGSNVLGTHHFMSCPASVITFPIRHTSNFCLLHLTILEPQF